MRPEMGWQGSACMLWGTDLRYAAAMVTLVPDVEIEFRSKSGETRVVSAERRADTVDAVEFRDAVLASLSRHDVRAVTTLLDLDATGPVRAAVRTSGIAPVERGARWRRRCACGDTDYLITAIEPDEAVSLAYVALEDEVPDVELRVWARPDRALHATVLACELPREPTDDDALGQALRDLTVMCRVRAGITNT